MNRYEQYLSRRPGRLAWKQSKIGAMLLRNWYPPAVYGAIRGITCMQGCDWFEREPA